MDKTDKKRAKLEARLKELETFLTTSLGKKTSSTKEIDLPKLMREIAAVKLQLQG